MSQPQAFDSAEFQHALAVLESEQNAMQLSRGQRLSLRFYSAFIAGVVIFLIAMIAYMSIKLRHETDLTDDEYVVLGMLAIGGLTCLGAAVVSLFLNLKLLLKIIHSRLRFRKMGFSDGSDALWRAHQKTRRFPALIEKFVLGFSIFLLIVTAIVMAYRAWGWASGVLCVSVVFAMFYVLQNGKAHLDMMLARLKELTRLKESMQTLASTSQAPGERIALPAEVIQQYSQVESEQIARSRAQAISESLQSTAREFSILSSQQVRQAKASLAPADRLKLEEALDSLMSNPRPATAQAESEDGVFRLPVTGTDLQVIYKVDDAGQRLRLLSLESSAVGSTSRA